MTNNLVIQGQVSEPLAETQLQKQIYILKIHESAGYNVKIIIKKLNHLHCASTL